MARELIAETTKRRVYRDGGRAVKVFSKTIPTSEVLNEALITVRIDEAGGINVPKILDVGVEENGEWAISYEFIEGKTLRQLMDENPGNMGEYMERMVDLQLSIHARTCPLLNKLKDKMSRQILEIEDLDTANRYDLRTRLDSMPKHTKLCHGDFRPEHIIVKDDGSMYVLGWIHATQGNASADAARTYLTFCLRDQALADQYLELFCRKTNTDKRYVQGWLPLVAAAQLSKKRPEEEELLHNWLNVVDYE